MADINLHRTITLKQVRRLLSSQGEIKEDDVVGEIRVKEGLLTIILRFEHQDLLGGV